MKIGIMNHPCFSVLSEIKRANKYGMDFVDLTLEPTKAYPTNFDCKKVKALAKELNMTLVGHTGWEIPWYSSYKRVRKVALKEFLLCLKTFKKLNIKLMNIHLINFSHIHEKNEIAWYSETLTPLLKKAKELKIRIMIEHTLGDERQMKVLDTLLKKHPSLLLHIDVGHSNLSKGKGNALNSIMRKHHKRLAHVHLSDNGGLKDDHIGLGKGKINWKDIAKTFKNYKYDGTFTLEVFSGEKDLITSKKLWEKIWG